MTTSDDKRPPGGEATGPYKRPPRFNELDYENPAHQRLAVEMKIQRCGLYCPNGHDWDTHGVLCLDGRIRCTGCKANVDRRLRERKRAINGGLR